jgi:hypothetical protein
MLWAEDERSDEIGIIVCGKGYDGVGYVLEDLSGHYSPEGWGKAAIQSYDKWQADFIVAEQNYGGDMVPSTATAARRNVPFKKVTASSAPCLIGPVAIDGRPIGGIDFWHSQAPRPKKVLLMISPTFSLNVPKLSGILDASVSRYDDYILQAQ